jgi:RHH-type proline utilization regulon transcriptional repressor/proline dehydrogenase/delta 1-pyrroline-5-carboxylate dehydrogenase
VTQSPTSDAAIEARTQALGRALLAEAARYRPGAAERVEDWLLTRAVADERFRSRLLRYMDVLAAFEHDEGGVEAKRLAREYFGDEFPDLPPALRWLLRIARDERLPAPVVGESARRSAELFARRFITPPGADTVTRTIEQLSALGRQPSFDLLGEAVLSDVEARDYVDRYLRLIAQLARDPAAGLRTDGDVAALQVSLKLSSLTAHFSPLDPDGTMARVRPALETIAQAARDTGIGVTIDMEQHAYRDLTWRIFTSTFARGERFGDWPGAGIVLQAYLREVDRHASEVVAFARERGVPFQVRLVKGAYWDFETITARANGWPPPVWQQKAETDAAFERVLGTLVPAYPALHLAVASHNARSHARAEAIAEAAGLPPRAIEHQTLFRTAEGTSRALASLGWAARDYVPVGELLPGMAYLVRRVLENSSQAGFLLQSRSGVDPATLLRPPEVTPPPSPPSPTRGYVRMAEARWFDPAFRDAFEAALASSRRDWGRSLPLRLGVEEVPTAEWADVQSPSHPGTTPIARVPLADDATAHRAADLVRRGAERWVRRPLAERLTTLRRAADHLEARAHEFAAYVVHEGGRDRDGAYAEVVEAVDYLRYNAEQAARLYTDFGGSIAPRGVVAVIPPWNFSLAIPCGMTAAALAVGNGVVLKPAGPTPVVAHHLVELLHEAGVPRDVLVWLPGRGSEAGQALVDSPDVAMVAFTGSRAVGTQLHADVARAHPPKALVAEMGGKNPVLVFADADLDEAVEGILRSAFGHAGQKCSAASRVLVAAPVFDRLRDRLVEASRSLAVGPAEAPGTQVNPIIDRSAWERLNGAARVAREECEVLLDRFAATPGTLERGPLIVATTAEHAPALRTFTDELFGPILVLVPFADEAEAIRLANATEYALTAGLYSRSPRTIARVARAIEAGTVYVNRGTTGARVAIEPFGGMRMSGTGPKAGSAEYLWAFVRRLDAPLDVPADAEVVAATGDRSPAVVLPADLGETWDEPLPRRIAVIEEAAAALGGESPALAAALLAAAQAAQRDLGEAQPTLQVAGQHTELRFDVPRRRGVLRATGRHAPTWLATALLAGNAVAVFDSPALAATVEALLAAGVPTSALAEVAGGIPTLLAAAESPVTAFAATDAGPALSRALARRLGPTVEGQRSLKALLSPLDGAQAGERGFTQRFAWPRVVAVRTLRHGADLAIEEPEEA